MNKTKQIAYGGMITLFSVGSLYLTTLIPTNKLILLGLSSFFLAAMVLDFGIKASLFVYIATSILSIILVPNKVIVLSYALFFGYYGILKSLIERINKLFFEWVLKLLSFNLAMLGIYLLTKVLFFGSIISPLPPWVIYLGIQPLFVLYDYFFSVGVKFYKERIRNRI